MLLIKLKYSTLEFTKSGDDAQSPAQNSELRDAQSCI